MAGWIYAWAVDTRWFACWLPSIYDTGLWPGHDSRQRDCVSAALEPEECSVHSRPPQAEERRLPSPAATPRPWPGGGRNVLEYATTSAISCALSLPLYDGIGDFSTKRKFAQVRLDEAAQVFLIVDHLHRECIQIQQPSVDRRPILQHHSVRPIRGIDLGAGVRSLVSSCSARRAPTSLDPARCATRLP